MKNLYLKSLFLSIPLLIFSGCSLGDKESSKENPDFIVQISNLEVSELELGHHFGDVESASKTQKIVINNDTSDPIGMNAYIEQPSPFAIQRSDCGASLAAGKSCFVNVVFSTRGLFDDTQETTSLILEDEKTIGLSAVVKNGKTPPNETETNLVFEGELPTPENPIRNVYLRNIGLGNATIQELTFGDNLVKRFDACPVNKVLKPKESCRIQLIIPRDERSSFESTSYEIKYADATNPGKTLSPNDEDVAGVRPFHFTLKRPSYGTTFNIPVVSRGGEVEPATYQIGDGELQELPTNDTNFPIGLIPVGGTIDVKIYGKFNLRSGSTKFFDNTLVGIKDWGTEKYPDDLSYFFRGQSDFNSITAEELPDFSEVTNMQAMFTFAAAFNQDISGWDVSSVANMKSMFSGAKAFNNGGEPLNWGSKTENVTDMMAMFNNATAFDNQGMKLNWSVPLIGSTPTGFRTNSVLTPSQEPDWGL